MKTPVLIALSVLTMALFSCNNNGGQQATDTNNQQAAPSTGGKTDANALFTANCMGCHNPNMAGTPALKGALARWDGDRNGIKAFIHNSAKLITEGDKHAVAVYEKYSHTQMTAFPNITDAEIDALIDTYMK